MLLGGSALMAYRAESLEHPRITERTEPVSVRGRLISREQRQSGERILLDKVDLWQRETGKWPAEKTPERLRLTVHTEIEEPLLPGMFIQTYAILNPIPLLPDYPGAYNMARDSYFQQVGAGGYTLGRVKIRKYTEAETSHSQQALLAAEAFRQRITTSIINVMGAQYPEETPVASAMLTGGQGAISKEIMENMRVSGLSHVLSISGLHMAIVMTGAYFLLRLLLAMHPSVALRYPIKQIAAFFALIIGFFYLMLSGWQVPAIRSFIMAGLFFLAILLGRVGSPLRPLALSALAILLITPEAIISPSFQMSYSAVIALVACYEWYSIYRRKKLEEKDYAPPRNYTFARKAMLYVVGVAATSLIAGLATAPFSIYHFGRFSNYSVLANLIGVPLTSFWILPFGMLGLILLPFGLGNIGLYPMAWGIAWMNDLTAWIAQLPTPTYMISQLPDSALLFMTVGGLWLFLWLEKRRYIGIFVILLGIGIALFSNPVVPDLIVDSKGKLFAVRTKDGTLAFSSFSAARRSRESWQQELGLENKSIIKPGFLGAMACIEGYCYGKDVLIVQPANKKAREAIKPLCDLLNGRRIKLLVLLGQLDSPCIRHADNILTHSQLAENGTHLIYFKPQLHITHVRQKIGSHIWTVAPQRVTNVTGK